LTDIRVLALDDGSVAMRGAVDVLRGAGTYSFVEIHQEHRHASVVDQPADRLVLLIDPFAVGGLPVSAISTMPSRVSVLVMTSCTEPGAIRQALQAGARGFVGKDVDVSTLLAAVGAIVVGGMYLAAAAQEILMQPADDDKPEESVAASSLTRREREVLTMVAKGLTHKQIGTRLSLTKATVDTYVHRIRQKVGAVNKAGLTRIAMQLGLVGRIG
jgi:two-component system nitrate/nitrite response regulator NarL